MLAIGRTTEIKIDKTAAVIVQQMDDEIAFSEELFFGSGAAKSGSLTSCARYRLLPF